MLKIFSYKKHILKKISKFIFSRKKNFFYWSNLSKRENKILLDKIKKNKTKNAINFFKNKKFLKDVIFSSKRSLGLKLLNIKKKEIAIDFGCMWGALTIPLAKKAKKVFGVDQTIESLYFLEKRAIEKNIKNITLINDNLRDIKLKNNSFDLAVVNGVLEWVGEKNDVIVENYLNKSSNANLNKITPKNYQIKFLKKIFHGLKKEGRIYLAIENRYDYKMFLGLKDPHSGLFFTTIIPKKIANFLSIIFKKRNYRTWIYSKTELFDLLNASGFRNINFYSCWPDYRFPEQIYKYDSNLNSFVSPFLNKKKTFRRFLASIIEQILFNKLNLHFLAPSFIVIANKN